MSTHVPAAESRTIIEKIWDMHHIAELEDGTVLIYIDRVLIHDRSGGTILRALREAGRPVSRPERVFGTYDHVIDTHPGRGRTSKMPGGHDFVSLFDAEGKRAGIRIFDVGEDGQGIVHVMAPELGIALPGITMVCGDSHTPTLGGVGALAIGVGNTQAEHALATGTLSLARPKRMRVCFEGCLPAGVSAKDIALAFIGQYSTEAAVGYIVEFTGAAVRALAPAGRMTLCNLGPEFSAITAIIAPDDVTIEFLAGKLYSPVGRQWDEAVSQWRQLRTDDDAEFDAEIRMDVSDLSPQVTWGTSPEHVTDVTGRVPDPAAERSRNKRDAMARALAYTRLTPGTPLSSVPIEAAFIGSCTNNRLDDLRAAARILQGRKVAAGVIAICVPGSTATKKRAEAEGLDRIFKAAGFEWREAGCSLCFFANNDSFGAAKRVISSTNRNFENRQGSGVATHLASPETVAASAIAGTITDPRRMGGLQ